MYRRAVHGRWPIPQEARAGIVAVLTEVALRPDVYGVREATYAASALLAADRLNLDAEARPSGQPALRSGPGEKPRLDFSHMSDADLDAFLESGGRSEGA